MAFIKVCRSQKSCVHSDAESTRDRADEIDVSPSDCALFKDALWFSIHDFNVRASHMSMGAGNNDDEFECVYYFK